MKKILNALIIVVMIVVGFTFTFGVNAASSDVYNVVTCPSEDMATSMRVNWQSDTAFLGSPFCLEKLLYTPFTVIEFLYSVSVATVYSTFKSVKSVSSAKSWVLSSAAAAITVPPAPLASPFPQPLFWRVIWPATVWQTGPRHAMPPRQRRLPTALAAVSAKPAAPTICPSAIC